MLKIDEINILKYFFKSKILIVFQMVAKGKDASDLFPPVVKNVVSKNLEVIFP